jgi:alanine racemase
MMNTPLRTLTLNFDACRHNYNTLKQQLQPHTKIMVCVKANAYGHGLESLAHILPHADGFAVSELDRAIKLRQGGFKNTILLMSTPGSTYLCEQVAKHQISWVIYSQQQINYLKAYQGDQIITPWIKMNTGMNRLGFLPHALDQVIDQLTDMPHVTTPGVLMTHLAEAEQTNPGFSLKQIERFNQAAKRHPDWQQSVGNSAAIFNHRTHLGDWVRPGIMVYGSSSLPSQSPASLGLKPMMNLTASLIDIHPCVRGDTIGYNRRWVCPNDTHIGVVSLGYGDGYPRSMPNGTPVIIQGVRCSIVGRISMDLICVDLQPCPHAQVGDQVTLWGEELPIEHIADCAGTSAYALMCTLSNRISRQVVWQGQTMDINTWKTEHCSRELILHEEN